MFGFDLIKYAIQNNNHVIDAIYGSLSSSIIYIYLPKIGKGNYFGHVAVVPIVDKSQSLHNFCTFLFLTRHFRIAINQ